MSNAVFPVMPGLKWDIVRTPQFSTRVLRSVNGKEVRGAFYATPIWKWKLSFEFLRQYGSFTELSSLLGFYLARRGSFDSFLFTDTNDYSVTAENFGTGNASTTKFQLSRALGGFSEPVKDLNATPQIYINGTLKTAGTDYTIDTQGLVTFTVAPASGATLTWTGTYYWRVRFATDGADFNQFMNQLFELKQLELVQDKVDPRTTTYFDSGYVTP